MMMIMNETAPIIAECRIVGSDLISYSEKGDFYIKFSIADPDFLIFLQGCQPGFFFAPLFTVKLVYIASRPLYCIAGTSCYACRTPNWCIT